MKKTFDFPKILLGASLIAAAASVIIRIILTLTLLDTKYGVYERGNILPDIYHIVLAVTVVGFIAASILLAPDRKPEYIAPSTSLTVFASCVSAFLLASDLFLTLYYIVTTAASPSIFDILEICFAVPSILFLLGLAKASNGRHPVLSLTSFFPTAWCAVCLIRIYFDTTALNTSPNKIISEIALLAAMLYFLTESRAALGIISHRFYLAAATCVPILLLTSAVPNLLLASRLSISVSDNFLHYAIEVAFALFIWARLAAYTFKRPTVPEDQIQ